VHNKISFVAQNLTHRTALHRSTVVHSKAELLS